MLSTIVRICLGLSFFLTPLIYSTHFADPFYTIKRTALAILGLVLSISVFIDHKQQKTRISIFAHQLIYLVLLLAYLLTAQFVSIAPTVSLTGEVTFLLALSPFIFIINNNHKYQSAAGFGLLAASLALSVYHLLALTKIIHFLPFTQVPSDITGPAGGLIASLVVIFTSLVLLPNTSTTKYLRYLQYLGLFSIIYLLFSKPESRPIAPSLLVGWSVLLDALKNPFRLLLGYGADSFENLYSAFRPVSVNLTPFWAIKFPNNWSKILETFSSVGLIGLVLWYQFFKSIAPKDNAHNQKNFYFIVILILTLTSPNIATIFVLLVSLIVFSDYTPVFVIKSDHKYYSTVSTTISIVCLAILALSSYKVGQNLSSTYLAGKANTLAAAENYEGNFKVQQQILSIDGNNFLNQLNYSSINLKLASLISNNQASPSAQVQEQFKKYLDDAVNANALAIKLNPQSAVAWQQQARLLTQLGQLDNKSTEAAFDAYQSALSTDPANPILYLELGNLFLQQNKPNEALSAYSQAVNLKNDLPDSHYLIAKLYTQTGNFESAKQAYENTLKLLDPNSQKELVEQVKKELDMISAELEKVPEKK